MKKIIVLTGILVLCLSVYCQTDSVSNIPQFAIVKLAPEYTHETDKAYRVVYSNGTSIGLFKLLKFSLPEEHFVKSAEFDALEFRMLNYFHGKGYELISINKEPSFNDESHQGLLRYYFKHK